MPITFTTRAHADVIMFKDVALQMIKLMGCSGTVPSAIAPEGLAQALTLLQEGILVQEAIVIKDVIEGVEQESADQEGQEQEQVSLHNRALPLIALLQAASDEAVSVMWE